MRYIKLLLLSVLLIFLLITAMSLLIPSHIRISKATNVMAEKDSVFQLVRDSSNWKKWHPAFMEGQGIANLQTELTRDTDSLVTIVFRSPKSGVVENNWQIHTHAASDSMTLQWYMDFDLPWYPWRKFGSLFYEKTYGSAMEYGLENIKRIVHEKDTVRGNW